MTARVTDPSTEQVETARRRYQAIRAYRFGTRLHYLVEGEEKSLCGRPKDQMVRHVFPFAASSCRVCQAAGSKITWIAQRPLDGEGT